MEFPLKAGALRNPSSFSISLFQQLMYKPLNAKHPGVNTMIDPLLQQ
jgi:hypothetical protein